MSILYTRRSLAVSVGTFGLAACASDLRKTSPFWSTVTNTRPQKADADIRAYAEGLDYASMLFWFDGQSRSLVVLGGADATDRLIWYTAEKQAISTYGPFITRAIGTEVELRETKFGDGWSSDVRNLVGMSVTRQTTIAHRGKQATATLVSTFRDVGPTSIDVLGNAYQVRQIDETMVAENRTRILNSYWVDSVSGEWRKARQQVIPLLAPVNTMIVKSPRS